MAQRFTNIFTVPRLSQLIFDQDYSSSSIDKLDQNQDGEYNYMRGADGKGKYVYEEIEGNNLEQELHAFFGKITEQLAKEFKDVEIKKKDGNISIQYRPYIFGEINDWIDRLLLYNLSNFGDILSPAEEGNDTTMPFSDKIHYTPSLFGKAWYRPLRKIILKPYENRNQAQNKKKAAQQRQRRRSVGQKNNILSMDPLSNNFQQGNGQTSIQKQMQMNQMNINAGAQKKNGTSEDLFLQPQLRRQLLENAQSNNLIQVQGTNQQQRDANKNMPQQKAFQLQNKQVVDQKPKQYQSVSARRTQQQQKQQGQLQKDKEQTIKEIMTLLRQKISYYDEMKLRNPKKYPNYVNKSRNKKFNQSVRKILSEESLKTLKIVKKKIEEFQPVSNLYPSNQRRLLTESLDKDKDVTIVALRNKLLGDSYKKLLFGDDFKKHQVETMNVSNLQKKYTQLSEKYQKERKEATLREEIAQRKRLEEIREKEQGEKRQAARIARQKKELDLQTRKKQLLEKGKRQTLQDPGEREELRDYYENNRHKINGENEITSQQLISLYDGEQNLPVFLKQIKQQNEQKRKKARELELQERKCKEHSETVNQLQKQIQAKFNRVNQLKTNIENDSIQVNRINRKLETASLQVNQLEKVIEDLSSLRTAQQKKSTEFCKNNKEIKK